ncbi:carboxylesterase family protein [Devosia ginsengisoli]|nr:carboxylesterase family protein [Devosia ginsengisoli]
MTDTIDVTSRQAIYRGIVTGEGQSFRGIRYAEAPIGPLRFRPPVRHENSGLVDATTFGNAAPQMQRRAPAWMPRGAGFQTGEDCLNLNVYTPAADGAKRPVIVHAFGGGFQGGAAQGGYHDDAGFAARGDVVLVRPNMRTGALGFLHLGPAMGDDYAAANRGMLDFVAALEWVRDNIAAFGGDPDNVTLIGMSSGSFTIAALFGMEGVADLYRRAWLMSGPASRIVMPDTATAITATFLDKAGIAPGDTAGLAALPVETILAIQETVLATHLGERNAPGGRTLGIVLDGTSLMRHPLENLASGRFRDHELVLGWARDEARMWYAFGIMPEVADRATLLASIARFRPEDPAGELARLEAELPGRSWTEYEEIFLSRAIYRDPALATASAQNTAGGRAYTYEFAWVPPFEGGRLGAAHGSDEPFVFGNVSPDRIPLTAGDNRADALAAEMSTALYAFARTGEPTWALADGIQTFK